jgi:hypothetical protein
MNTSAHKKQLALLAAGDVLALALVTLIGFASHGELSTAGKRMLATFFPLLAGWFLTGPAMGAYDLERVMQPRQLWRPAWGMFVGGAVAAGLRGLWLNAPIIPSFLFVLSSVSALGMLVWRSLAILLFRRSGQLTRQTLKG